MTPSELVDLAFEKGISTLALTDHDTVSGLKEASLCCQTYGIHFLPGVELQINYSKGEFHLLGLGLKQITSGFSAAMQRIIRMRNERNEAILELINQEQERITPEELYSFSHTEAPGRPHIAQLMVNKGMVRNIQDAFDRFLGYGRPYYQEKKGIDLDEAIEHIHRCGGRAVVAHPFSLYISWGHLAELIPRWKEQGIDGVEAYHPGINLRSAKRLEKLVRDHDLMVSGGSDYHGKKRKDRFLGKTSDGHELPDDFAEPWMED